MATGTGGTHALQSVSGTLAHGATHAFSQRPLSQAFRPFIGPILKGSKGSIGDIQSFVSNVRKGSIPAVWWPDPAGYEVSDSIR